MRSELSRIRLADVQLGQRGGVPIMHDSHTVNPVFLKNLLYRKTGSAGAAPAAQFLELGEPGADIHRPAARGQGSIRAGELRFGLAIDRDEDVFPLAG